MDNNGLKALKFQPSYDPTRDDLNVVDAFYNPCLLKSKSYDRCSAYFSSNVLKVISQGLIALFHNNGHIRLILSCQIDGQDMDTITQGYKERMDSFADGLNSESLFNDFEVANLSYLIAHGYCDVKICFMLRERSSLMHYKFGIFRDTYNNSVAFSGSGNETESGLLFNAEQFNVFTSWDNAAAVKDSEDRFEGIWNNTYSPKTMVSITPSGKLFDKLISFNKGRTFESEEDYCSFQKCILIDVDKNKDAILLRDFTTQGLLIKPYILKTKFANQWQQISDKEVIIPELTTHILRDKIIKTLMTNAIPYCLSFNAELFLNENDLALDKRLKAGLAIKTDTHEVEWIQQYAAFKELVNNETETPLREQQMKNAFFHFVMKSSCDYSVPGTGKTYISYGMFAYLSSKKINQVNRLVVFGPLNCFPAWKDEGKAIFGSKRNLYIFDCTSKTSRDLEKLAKEIYDVYLFNYEFLNPEKAAILSKYVLNRQTMVVFDEIHKLKAVNGVRANNFLSLLNSCTEKPIYKLALTGTPLPNSFVDIYNHLRLLYPDDLSGVFSYLSEGKLRASDNNPILARQVKDTISPFFVRTTKKELGVPEPDPDDLESLSVSPTSEEKNLYMFIWTHYDNFLVKYIRLVQATSNPRLLNYKINISDFESFLGQDDSEELEGVESAAKLEAGFNLSEIKSLVNAIPIASKTRKAIESIQSLVSSHQKVLVWCLFIDTIDFIDEQLTKLGINCVTVCGRDSQDSRVNKISQFKLPDPNSPQVLITNPNTLAESVSLHKICHNAIYLEFGFNLTYLLQSKDRINRVGLLPTDHTHYSFAISKNDVNMLGSIDLEIYNKLKKKADRMYDAIESKDICPFNDTNDLDDIRDIIESLQKK